MAEKTLTKIKSTGPNAVTTAAKTSVAAADDVYVEGDFKDEFTQFHIKCGGSAGNITFKAGNGYAAVNDEIFAMEANTEYFVHIDTSRFKLVSGEKAGMIHIVPAVACDIAVCESRV